MRIVIIFDNIANSKKYPMSRRLMKRILFFPLSLAFSLEQVELNPVEVSGVQYKLDDLNRNVYVIDSSFIENKGFQDTKSIFSSLPFVTFSDFGLGANIDLRGQGASANVNTQVLFNGISMNMLDSSHGVTPLGSISPDEVENIEILAGGGAVMYGNGTRGGVVNINTKRRYEKLYSSLGTQYSYSNGNRVRVDAKVADKVADKFYYMIGGNYQYTQGYRDKDSAHFGGVNTSLTWDINPSHSIFTDFSYFTSLQNTTPLLRFSNISSPSKSDRSKAGDGEIISVQDRYSQSIGYEARFGSDHALNLKAFFHHYKLGYKKNLQIMDYSYNNLYLENTHISQDGSSFVDEKFGLQAKYTYTHHNGELIAGVESIYQKGKRDLKLDINWSGNASIPLLKGYHHIINTQINANKWTNALYLLERYNFTEHFSLTGGARYELALYTGERELYNEMNIQMGFPISPSPYSLYKSISDLRHNYALELTPRYVFDFGDTYAKYERGFRSPNPDNLTSRNGSGSKSEYLDTNVKSETFDTFEVGAKFFVDEYATFFLTGYYTLTHDEIYTLGSAHTGNGFKVGNYKLTQRAGVELASEQSFLEGILGFGESFSYVDARIIDSGVVGIANGSIIPYVSNYKVTLSANYRFIEHWNLWISSSFVGAQKDTAQNTIPAYNLTDIGMDFTYEGFSLSFGVRNVADTLYYSFYNKDKSDEITGYAFLIAEGRSFFVNGRYKF